MFQQIARMIWLGLFVSVIVLSGCSGDKNSDRGVGLPGVGLPDDAKTYLREKVFTDYEISSNTDYTAKRATEDEGKTNTIWCIKLRSNGQTYYFFLKKQDEGWNYMGFNPISLRAADVYDVLGCNK